MDSFALALNDILVEAYHNILHCEEEALRQNAKTALSINEIHLIDCVSKHNGEGRPVSPLAGDLSISRPSATVAVTKLVKKGYLKKLNCQNDGRVVRVRLTAEGCRINDSHHRYHLKMVQALTEIFTEEEKHCLMRGIEKLNLLFDQKTLDFFVEES
ncbi:MAG: MarR family transcriptional regulator [Bacillota bacterium]|nr:MarR family transcriptional regulator [Bacillota bacterium]